MRWQTKMVRLKRFGLTQLSQSRAGTFLQHCQKTHSTRLV
jgi:hypothetical protein